MISCIESNLKPHLLLEEFLEIYIYFVTPFAFLIHQLNLCLAYLLFSIFYTYICNSRSLSHSLIYLLAHSFIYSFLYSSIHSFQFIQPFLYLFVICLQKGMINYMGSSFFMQPLAAHLAKHYGPAGGSRPHLIYRRSLDDVKNECQISGEIIY